MALSLPDDEHDPPQHDEGPPSDRAEPFVEAAIVPPPVLGLEFSKELLRRARGVRSLSAADDEAFERYLRLVWSTAPKSQASGVTGRFVLDGFTHVRQIAGEAPPEGPSGWLPDGSPAASHSRVAWATVFTWIRNIGAIILLFVAWQLWGTAIAQHQAQDSLRSQFDALVHSHKTTPTTAPGKPVPLIPATAAVTQPAEGAAIARLQIPALGLDEISVAGTSTGDLSKGPGHYTGTAMPGQAGNIAIAGHRTTDGAPFNRLGTLVIGDRIILTSLSGQQYTYIVSKAPVAVSPSDIAVLDNFGDNRITLTTCTPEFSAAQRLIVVGEYSGGATVVPPQVRATPIPYRITDSNTASWNWGALPIVLPEIGLLVGIGLLAKRIRLWLGRRGQWLLLVPLWLAGLYFLFSSLTSLLPPSV